MKTKTYSITLENGTVSQVKANDMASAMSGLSEEQRKFAVKVEKIDFYARRNKKKLANNMLHEAFSGVGQYRPKGKQIELVIQALENAGIATEKVLGFDFPGENGVQSLEIEPELYLTVTWYRMGSGNYEFVAYLP